MVAFVGDPVAFVGGARPHLQLDVALVRHAVTSVCGVVAFVLGRARPPAISCTGHDHRLEHGHWEVPVDTFDLRHVGHRETLESMHVTTRWGYGSEHRFQQRRLS